MCLSTVYIQSQDRRIKVMQDVAQMEYCQAGYLLTGLLGDQKFVKGRIMSIDFADDHEVVLEKEGRGGNKCERAHPKGAEYIL